MVISSPMTYQFMLSSDILHFPWLILKHSSLLIKLSNKSFSIFDMLKSWISLPLNLGVFCENKCEFRKKSVVLSITGHYVNNVMDIMSKKSWIGVRLYGPISKVIKYPFLYSKISKFRSKTVKEGLKEKYYAPRIVTQHSDHNNHRCVVDLFRSLFNLCPSQGPLL